jgi:PAS domain S-box-containing protein
MDALTGGYVTGDAAFAVDRRGIIVFWNGMAEEGLGFSSGSALGQKCWKLLGGHDSNDNRYCCRHCPIREMAFKHEPIFRFRASFKTAGNDRKQFEVSSLTVPSNNGKDLLMHICHPADTGVKPLPENGSKSEQLDHLSDREMEILKLLAEGVKTKDIASGLSISIRTVRTHIQHLMYKLQVHNRKAAVRKGRRLQLI